MFDKNVYLNLSWLYGPFCCEVGNVCLPATCSRPRANSACFWLVDSGVCFFNFATAWYDYFCSRQTPNVKMNRGDGVDLESQFFVRAISCCWPPRSRIVVCYRVEVVYFSSVSKTATRRDRTAASQCKWLSYNPCFQLAIYLRSESSVQIAKRRGWGK